MSEPAPDALLALREKYPEMAEATIETIAELVTALRKAKSMALIEFALDYATGEGAIWPQCEAGYPNPAAALMFSHLLARHPAQGRAALAYRTALRPT